MGRVPQPSPACKLSAAEIVASARITDVWAALGGESLRHGRGRAFWRDGDGFNVAVSDAKNTWFDHRDGVGGGVLDLIVLVRECSRSQALAWLADYLGIALDSTTPELRQRWRRERDELRYSEAWARCLVALAEAVLEDLAYCPDREVYTRLIAIARRGGDDLLAEFRAWKTDWPDITRAMVAAGQTSNARLQRQLAEFIRGMGEDVAA